MKIIGTIVQSAPKKYSTEISFSKAAPVLVQITLRAKRRRAHAEIKAQSSGKSHVRTTVADVVASRTRQARKDLIAALHNSFQAGNAKQQQQELEAETEAPQYAPVQQAREFYDTELRPQMEKLYDGQYIAIHPESRSYSVQPGYGKAFRALRVQQPLGPIIVHNIGLAGSGLKARLRGEQP